MFLKILSFLLLPLIWGLAVEYVFEALRRRRDIKAAEAAPKEPAQ